MIPMTRRKALSLLAVTTAGGVLVPRTSIAQESPLLLPGTDVCIITPEVTEGPYYFDPSLVRADISEGRPGLPTQVRLQVVDESCEPLANARVDIWHADAIGLYSGFTGQLGNTDTSGETFMRGTLFTDADGIVEFATIYPGWYPGRTPHIHFKVFLDETTLLTGQLFFPDEVSQQVYASIAPYNERGGTQDTLNGNDGIARQAGEASIATIEQLPDAYLVQMIIGVEPLNEFGGMSAPSSG